MTAARDIERFRRIEAIFDAALEHPPGAERDAFLREQQRGRCRPACRGSTVTKGPRTGERGRSRRARDSSAVWTVAGHPAAGPGRNGRGVSGGTRRWRFSHVRGGQGGAAGARVSGYRRALPPRAAVSGQPGPSESGPPDRWRRHHYGPSLSGDGVRRRPRHRSILRHTATWTRARESG